MGNCLPVDALVSCDWLKLRAVYADDLPQRLTGGRVLVVADDGQIEADRDRWHQYRDSSDVSVMIRAVGAVLEIDGNIGRLGQAHNVLTPSVRACFDRASALCVDLGFPPLPEGRTIHRTARDDASMVWGTTIQRIDLNAGIVVSKMGASALMAALGTLPAGPDGRVQGMPGKYGPVWGLGSRRWSAKSYDKGLQGGKAARDAFESLGITDDQTLIRLEVGIRTMELEKYADADIRSWDVDGHEREVIVRYLGRQLAGRVSAGRDSYSLLPGRLAAWACLWRDGVDLREHMSKATWYRVRRELLEHGIEIKYACDISRLRHKVELIEGRVLRVGDVSRKAA